MSRLQELEQQYRPPGWRAVAWLVMALVVAFAGWLSIAELDEVAVAPGQVVPRGKVKVIQHLEGGIIKEILVSEGDAVAPETPLVRLDLAPTQIDSDDLTIRIDGLQLRRARILAEADGVDPSFPDAQAARHAGVVAAERRTFAAHREQLASRTTVLQAQQRQKELDLEELLAKQRAHAKNLALTKEKLGLSERLMAKNLTPKMEHIQLQRDVGQIEGKLAAIAPTIPRARAAIAEAAERIHGEQLRARRTALQELSAVELEIERLKEHLLKASEQALRMTIRSPIKGVVKNLRYHTIGGIVAPGDALMEIVPSDERLVIEARLSPVHRGSVHVGLPALVRVSAYDFFQYGGLDGTVVHIGADASRSPEGAYFGVIVETKTAFLRGDTALPITPGMEATVDIKTGTRSVLSYLLKPLLRVRHEAFREH